MRPLRGHILPRNTSNFTHSNLDFKNFSRGETPGLLLTGAGKGRGWERVPTSKGRGGRERTGEGREGWEGRGKDGRGGPASGGGILLQGLRGIDAPGQYDNRV